MRKEFAFVLHVLVALVASTVLGGVLLMIAGPLVGKSRNPWFDVPYSPFLWGLALFLGLLINRAMRNTSAKWVWIVGVCWLTLLVLGDIKSYNQRWCGGCSLLQFIRYSYFSYWNCTSECLGQLFATTPMLNSIAYSIGAAIALKLWNDNEKSGVDEKTRT